MTVQDVIRTIRKGNVIATFTSSIKNTLNYEAILENGEIVMFSIPFRELEDIEYTNQMDAKLLCDWVINFGIKRQPIIKEETENSKAVGKYLIVTDLLFSDFFKDENGKICVFDTFKDAGLTCGMYEPENALILKVECNYVEPPDRD